MSCRIVGVLIMEDEAGGDEKLLCVPSSWLTKRYDGVHDYTDKDSGVTGKAVWFTLAPPPPVMGQTG